MKKRAKRKFNRFVILEALARFGERSVEELIKFCVNLPTTFFEYHSVQSANWYRGPDIDIKLESRVKLWNLISKLKSERLILRSGKNYDITKNGFEYLNKRPPRHIRYRPVNNTSAKITLVIFDVPERRKAWRDWLRLQLTAMGFAMLQQSVWYSHNLLPEEFIRDLERYKLLPYIHVLSVNKQGTLSDWFQRIGKHDLVSD